MNKWIIKRLSEPSTYASLAGLAIIAGLNSEQTGFVFETLAGIFAFIGVLMNENEKA